MNRTDLLVVVQKLLGKEARSIEYSSKGRFRLDILPHIPLTLRDYVDAFCTVRRLDVRSKVTEPQSCAN